MWHNHDALSRGLGLGLIRWIERAAQRTKGPQLSTNLGPGQRSTIVARSQERRGNVGTTEGRVGPEGGRPASPRPAGLQLSAFGPHNKYRPKEAIRDVCAKAVARWPHPQAGLGEAGRPHLVASRAPASRGRQAHRPYLLTTDAMGFNCQEPTLEGYK